MWMKGVEAKNEYLMTNNYFPPSSRVPIEPANLGHETCIAHLYVYVYTCMCAWLQSWLLVKLAMSTWGQCAFSY